MRAITTFSAPLSSGPAAVTLVGLPFCPIHTPSGCANLSLLSERIVIQRTGPLTSSPAAFLGAFSPVRKGPVPENSLPSRKPGMAHTPWFGVPPRMAWLTVWLPPPLYT